MSLYHLYERRFLSFNWEEVKATVEVNFPNYGHALLSMEEFIDALK